MSNEKKDFSLQNYYFTNVGNTYGGQNKLQKSIIELIKAEDRLHIPADKLKDYKQALLDKITALNKQFPRCRPVKASWYDNQRIGGYLDFFIYFDEVAICSFSLYQSRDYEKI